MPAKQEGPRGFEMKETEPAAADDHGMPPATFATFVLSLSTSAMMHLGVVTPEDGEAALEPDLRLARHTIEILEMIRDRTQGNLAPEESELLGNILHDLHIRFVEAGRA